MQMYSNNPYLKYIYIYIYLGLTEGEFEKQRYYDHVKSFKNKYYANSTTLSSYVWKKKKRKNVASTLTW